MAVTAVVPCSASRDLNRPVRFRPLRAGSIAGLPVTGSVTFRARHQDAALARTSSFDIQGAVRTANDSGQERQRILKLLINQRRIAHGAAVRTPEYWRRSSSHQLDRPSR